MPNVSTAPNRSLLLLFHPSTSMWMDLQVFCFFPLHSHITSVLGDVMAGWGFEVKELWWSWECGKPSSVQSNHSRPSIILPLWYLHPTFLNPSPHRVASLLFHYSQLTSQKIRVTLGSPPTSPYCYFSLHLPSFYFSPITPSSLVGIWRVTLGQFNLSSSSGTKPAGVLQPLTSIYTRPAGCHPVFCISHFRCPPVLHRTFYFLICHSCFPFTHFFFKPYLWLFQPRVFQGRCFKDGLVVMK